MSKKSTFTAPMDFTEFRDALNGLGLSQPQYSALTGLNLSTINRRTTGQSEVPSEAAILLRILNSRPELIELAWKVAGLPGGIENRPVGRPPKRA